MQPNLLLSATCSGNPAELGTNLRTIYLRSRKQHFLGTNTRKTAFCSRKPANPGTTPAAGMSARASIEMRQHFVAASTVDLTDDGDRISDIFLPKNPLSPMLLTGGVFPVLQQTTDRERKRRETFPVLQNDRPRTKKAKNVPGPTKFTDRKHFVPKNPLIPEQTSNNPPLVPKIPLIPEQPSGQFPLRSRKQHFLGTNTRKTAFCSRKHANSGTKISVRHVPARALKCVSIL